MQYAVCMILEVGAPFINHSPTATTTHQDGQGIRSKAGPGKKEEDQKTRRKRARLRRGRVHDADAADEISTLPPRPRGQRAVEPCTRLALYLYLAPLGMHSWPREIFRTSRVASRCCLFPRARRLASPGRCPAAHATLSFCQSPACCATKRGPLFQSRPGPLPQSVLVPARRGYGREADGAAGPFISRCYRVRNAAATATG